MENTMNESQPPSLRLASDLLGPKNPESDLNLFVSGESIWNLRKYLFVYKEKFTYCKRVCISIIALGPKGRDWDSLFLSIESDGFTPDFGVSVAAVTFTIGYKSGGASIFAFDNLDTSNEEFGFEGFVKCTLDGVHGAGVVIGDGLKEAFFGASFKSVWWDLRSANGSPVQFPGLKNPRDLADSSRPRPRA